MQTYIRKCKHLENSFVVMKFVKKQQIENYISTIKTQVYDN